MRPVRIEPDAEKIAIFGTMAAGEPCSLVSFAEIAALPEFRDDFFAGEPVQLYDFMP